MRAPRRVLLLDPGQLYWPRDHVPLPVHPALLALYSALRRGGVEVEVLDLGLEPLHFPTCHDEVPAFARAIDDLLAEQNFDVLGISCFSTYSFQSTLLVARSARRLRPAAHIVVGGWHALSEAADFEAHSPDIDFVVTGSGEHALLAIARGELTRGPSIRTIPGGSLSEVEHDALEYLVEAYVTEGARRHASVFQSAERTMLAISRGCPHACRFCANRFVDDRRWTAFSVDRCLALVEASLRALPSLRICYLGDAFFGPNASWRHAFLTEFRARFRELPLVLITRAELLGPRDLDLLADRRTFVVLGVESLSPEMLRIMNKSMAPERYVARTVEVMEGLRARGVPHEIYIILGHPGETEALAEATRTRLEENLGPGTSVAAFRYLHLPQFARDYDELRTSHGTEFQGNLRWWAEPEFHTPEQLDQRYVPSKLPGESFVAAKARLDRAAERTHATTLPYARRRSHLEVLLDHPAAGASGARG